MKDLDLFHGSLPLLWRWGLCDMPFESVIFAIPEQARLDRHNGLLVRGTHCPPCGRPPVGKLPNTTLVIPLAFSDRFVYSKIDTIALFGRFLRILRHTVKNKGTTCFTTKMHKFMKITIDLTSFLHDVSFINYESLLWVIFSDCIAIFIEIASHFWQSSSRWDSSGTIRVDTFRRIRPVWIVLLSGKRMAPWFHSIIRVMNTSTQPPVWWSWRWSLVVPLRIVADRHKHGDEQGIFVPWSSVFRS